MAKIPFFFILSFFFLLAVTDLKHAHAARMLDEFDGESQPQFAVTVTPPPAAIPSPTNGQIPTTTADDQADSPVPETTPASLNTPIANPAVEGDLEATGPAPVAVVPVAGPPTTVSPTGSVPVPAAVLQGSQTSSPVSGSTEPFSFFMHDILGGSHPSARVVTGIIANSENNGNGIAFSKANDNFFPIQGAVPLLNTDNINNIVNNQNNLPLLAGLNGGGQGNAANLLLQNSANNGIVNGNGNQPFVTAGQIPSRSTLQQLMFGSVTVIDDELTEGQELGSAVIGRAQGFYMASSLDGTSQTLALTALFHGGGGGHDYDSISFFGVHRTATPVSQIAVIGGTGKYEHAKGYAAVETLHHVEDQHTTDGVDTIVHFSVYLSE